MRYVSKLFLALCLALGVGAVAADAQIASDVTLEADIPQPFVVEKTTLPAGKYTIRAADDYGDPNVLVIRSANGHSAVVFEAEGTQPRRVPGKSELVFDKVGDTYFLSQIFVEGENTGSLVPKSRMERKLEGKGLNSEKHSVAAHKRSSSKSAKNSS